ncbi:glutathione S-transferase family protein [Massilia sp. TS11]|uniref:glutathione S-transferase family protein n=1 Tax=Massilia sp. TS11 TaxID=2908003 RepID=UPI001EDBB9C7|nr:glutathione S-transferase family protein [Massilia sp. TS11]MCG2583716.1 glutathione S-transferase family protein [Massilia sp. TS11]
MSQPRLELVSHALCPYVQRAAIVLAEKGLPFTRTTIDLADKPDWFRALSPLGKVPLLKVDAAVLFESAPIVDYLDEAFAPALHPRDLIERARHRAWVAYASQLLDTIGAFYNAADAGALAAQRAALRQRFERLEQELDAGPYFGGAAFSIVDAAFAPAFRYFEVFDRLADVGVFSGLARVQAWRAALAARPSVRQAVGPDYAQRLLDFLRQRPSVLGVLAGRSA